jgi:DNA-binding response OmpR family regulator
VFQTCKQTALLGPSFVAHGRLGACQYYRSPFKLSALQDRIGAAIQRCFGAVLSLCVSSSERFSKDLRDCLCFRAANRGADSGPVIGCHPLTLVLD